MSSTFSASMQLPSIELTSSASVSVSVSASTSASVSKKFPCVICVEHGKSDPFMMPPNSSVEYCDHVKARHPRAAESLGLTSAHRHLYYCTMCSVLFVPSIPAQRQAHDHYQCTFCPMPSDGERPVMTYAERAEHNLECHSERTKKTRAPRLPESAPAYSTQHSTQANSRTSNTLGIPTTHNPFDALAESDVSVASTVVAEPVAPTTDTLPLPSHTPEDAAEMGFRNPRDRKQPSVQRSQVAWESARGHAAIRAQPEVRVKPTPAKSSARTTPAPPLPPTPQPVVRTATAPPLPPTSQPVVRTTTAPHLPPTSQPVVRTATVSQAAPPLPPTPQPVVRTTTAPPLPLTPQPVVRTATALPLPPMPYSAVHTMAMPPLPPMPYLAVPPMPYPQYHSYAVTPCDSLEAQLRQAQLEAAMQRVQLADQRVQLAEQRVQMLMAAQRSSLSSSK